jgi:hypothetical protein
MFYYAAIRASRTLYEEDDEPDIDKFSFFSSFFIFSFFFYYSESE